MVRSKVVMISGMPCTGKTSIGRMLENELNLPFFSRDMFKEALFDYLGWESKECSQKLGAVTFKILFDVFKELISNNRSFIYETNFFKDLIDKHFREISSGRCDYLEIHCYTPKEILIPRFKKQEKSDDRHPGHKYFENVSFMEEAYNRGTYDSLKIGKLIMVNISDFNSIDFDSMLVEVRELLQK